MSRDLPPNPNLEHLKKQAKALLDKLRQGNPDATLVDAQHTLAREYAFPSWPKLKAHVEALPAAADAPQPIAAPAPRPMFDRFTHDARKALFFSRFEASQLGRIRIAPEHVLLGVMKDAGGLTQALLTTAGVTVEEARRATTVADAPREEIVEPVEIPFQSLTKAVFIAAADEADRLGHEQIATVHLMLGVLRESDYAGTFLRAKGLTLDAVRQAAAGAQPDQLQ
jgi:hypothetical protein